MRTQETFSLFQSAREIRVAIVTDGERIGGLLNQTHPVPVDDDDPVFDYRRHMRHLVHQLDQTVDGTSTAEDRHVSQLIRIARVKSDRDEQLKRSHGKMVSARQGLEGIYKDGGFELAFLSGDTPRVPSRLLEQLEQTIQLLEEPAVEPRDAKVDGFSVDFCAVAKDLDSERVALRDAVDRLAAARKKAEGLLVVKREAIETLQRTILWIGRITEGLFHLAGESELAERIRSSTRRPLRPSEQPEEEKTAAEDGADGASSPESAAEHAPETERKTARQPVSSSDKS